MRKIMSRITAAIKSCLGLNKALSNDKLYTWLYELTPSERAQFSLLRTLRSLTIIKHKITNLEYFTNKITSCCKSDLNNYLQGKTKLKDLKLKVIKEKAKNEGILCGKPFETLYSNDLDWLRYSTKELDIFRWNGKTCFHCGLALNTEHLKTCIGTRKDRDDIKNLTGIEAEKVMDDPSLLNSEPDKNRKNLKSFVAGRISKMIHTAKSRGTM